jgi:RecA/RadA recombinase
MAKKQTVTEELTEAINGRPAPQAGVQPKDLLSTGSTLLDLSLTGRRQGAWPKGTYSHIVGDSNAGKTWFALNTFAEAGINPRFEDYQFIYNCPEGGAIMDREYFFGKKTTERIEDISTPTVQELYYDLKRRLVEGEPFIYVLDSETAVSSKERKEQHEKERAYDEGESKEKPSGSYDTDKPSYHSAHLNEITERLKETGSIMLWISQTRDNIGFGSQFKPKTYSGGHALKFYATYQIWVAVRETLKIKFRSKDRQQGIKAQLRVVKNRVTGRSRVVEVPIYHSYGVDDIGSCVDWMLDEGIWKPSKKKGEEGIIHATQMDIAAPDRDALVKMIDEGGRRKELQIIVEASWGEIENAIKLDRKPRYE